MSDSVEWLRNFARNYADGVAGMTPQEHRAWEVAEEIERLRAQVVSWCHTKDLDQAEIERLRAALRPLLTHYLNCYDGLEDQLAKDARAALEGK